jgi:hypothetical protein
MLKLNQAVVLSLCSCVWGQTQVDLRSQSKSADFSGFTSTRPVKTGTTLPVACSTGDLYFKSDAPAGSNLFACTSANNWAQLNGGAAEIAVSADGTPVGARSALNFVNGAGILTTVVDTGAQINAQQSLDSALVLTQPAAQAGQELLCASASGSGTHYTCNLMPTLSAYTTGMVLLWKADVDAAGGATTLNIDTLGAKPVKLADGVADPAPRDVAAGQLYPVWYDGNSFRLLNIAPVRGADGATRPACGITLAGRWWFSPGSPGFPDHFSICAKDGSGTYDWQNLY